MIVNHASTRLEPALHRGRIHEEATVEERGDAEVGAGRAHAIPREALRWAACVECDDPGIDAHANRREADESPGGHGEPPSPLVLEGLLRLYLSFSSSSSSSFSSGLRLLIAPNLAPLVGQEAKKFGIPLLRTDTTLLGDLPGSSQQAAGGTTGA